MATYHLGVGEPDHGSTVFLAVFAAIGIDELTSSSGLANTLLGVVIVGCGLAGFSLLMFRIRLRLQASMLEVRNIFRNETHVARRCRADVRRAEAAAV